MKCKFCKYLGVDHDDIEAHGYCEIELPSWVPVITVNMASLNKRMYLGHNEAGDGSDGCDVGQPKTT